MNTAQLVNEITMSALDWVHLFLHFCELSFLAVGGAISAAPDMHRYLVAENHLLSESQFSTSITLAQVAPGPNVLFVSLMGWNIGLNTAGGIHAGWVAWCWGLFGAVLCMVAMMLPSSVMMYKISQWGHKNSQRASVRAFKAGLAPIVIGLMLSTGWLLQRGQHLDSTTTELVASWSLTAISALLVWKTRIHLLWLLAAGAILGVLGIF
jgi:chromate transporter